MRASGNAGNDSARLSSPGPSGSLRRLDSLESHIPWQIVRCSAPSSDRHDDAEPVLVRRQIEVLRGIERVVEDSGVHNPHQLELPPGWQ